MCVCVYVHMSAVPAETRRGQWILLEVELQGCCELPDMVAGTSDPFPEQHMLLTAHPSLHF